MLQQLETAFLRLEHHTNDFLLELKGFSEQQIQLVPETNSWSGLLVAEHLIIVEEILVKGLKEKPERKPVQRGVRDHLMGVIVAIYLGLGLKVKAPTPAILPTGNLPPAEINPRWNSARTALRDYLESLNHDTSKNILLRHPIAGPLDAVATVKFLAQHVTHHQKQLRRIKAALSKVTR